MFRYIDPDTLVVVTLPDVPGPDVMPPCPVCGTPIEQDMIDVTSYMDPYPPQYIPGMWECPNGCDPRNADPRWVGR